MTAQTNNSALAMATASAPTRVEPITLPGFGPASKKGERNLEDYRVRYIKLDLDDPGSVAEAEIIETRGLKGEDIVVLYKDKFTFMDKYFLIIQYLELKEETQKGVSVG
jgi:hypothetical protein